jgi:probable HAF family extracellular repeat protein
MKSRILMSVTAMTLLAALAMPVQFAAQEQQKPKPQHHHYQVIDIGTFGGPSSYFNDLSLSDRFGFGCCPYGFAKVLNQQGILAGWADTSMPDPYPGFCFDPDCLVAHAFHWQNGAKTDLGVLPGGASSAALWINANASTVGYSQNGELDPLLPGKPEVRAVLWDRGGINDLGTLGGNESSASAINDRGQVAGTTVNTIPDPYSFFYLLFNGSSNGTQTRAFLWDKDGGMQDLGTLGGHDASPSLVNDHGQVAGVSYTNNIPNSTTGIPTNHPFLWDKKKGMQDLGTLGGTSLGSVNGLNEQGQVAGNMFIAGDQVFHPFLWDGTKMNDLGTLGGEGGGASWINEAGEVVGGATLPVQCSGAGFQIAHGFLWKKGKMTDLGTVAGTPNSEGDFINSKSQIVGLAFACDFSVFNAILWEDGSMVDLNTLIPHNSPFHLKASPFIDDQGVIAAFGSLANGDMRALLLTPCDENHPGVEGCDYSLVDVPDAVGQTSPAIGNASSRTLPPSLMRRMSRYGFPGPAFGPRN